MALRFCITLLLVVQCVLVQSNVLPPVRIATALLVTLRPSGFGCVNVTQGICGGGFAYVNHLLRKSAANHPQQIVLTYIDDVSKFVQFHPAGLSINALAWSRMNISGWTFSELGILTRASTPEVLNLMRKASKAPVISNAIVDIMFPLYDIIRRELIVELTDSGIRVGLLILNDWHRIIFPMYEPSMELPSLLAHLRAFYLVNITVAMLGRPIDGWETMTSMDVDILWLGTDTNSSIATPPPVEYINGTAVVRRSAKSTTLGFVDIDVNLWIQSLSYPSNPFNFVNYSEIDLTNGMNFTANPILDDPQFDDDVRWMQEQMVAAEHNDWPLGNCSFPVPMGTDYVTTAPCQYSECELGNWWTKVLFDYVQMKDLGPVDLTFYNGGSFRSGWPAGLISLSSLYGSLPFPDNLCVFSIYGIDLYDIMQYSFSKGLPTAQWQDDHGPFCQWYGAKFVHNPSLNEYRIIDIKIKQNGEWAPLERAKVYRVATTSFICNRGDGYGFIQPYPGTTKTLLDVEVHNFAREVVAKRGSIECPTLEGRIMISNSKTPIIMNHVHQFDCGPNTIWVPSLLDCVACPTGRYTDGYGQTECLEGKALNNGSNSSSSTTMLIIIICCIGGFVVLFAFCMAVLYYYRRKQRTKMILAAAPTGTVTIVFTDIQGSTNLWDTLPDDMAIALDIHNQIIRDEIAKHNGYEVKTIGDSFMISFRSEVEAVEFGIEVQRKLLSHQGWPLNLMQHEHCQIQHDTQGNQLWGGLRVRMGMEVGSPDVVVDHNIRRVDYFGPMVNLAARVESKAHGGEIVVTKTIADHLEDHPDLKSKLHVSFCGAFMFKGITHEVPVFSIQPLELAGRTFPPDKPISCEKCAEAMQCPRCDMNITRRRRTVLMLSTVGSVVSGTGAGTGQSPRMPVPHSQSFWNRNAVAVATPSGGGGGGGQRQSVWKINPTWRLNVEPQAQPQGNGNNAKNVVPTPQNMMGLMPPSPSANMEIRSMGSQEPPSR